jgi:hypothetical protein
MWSTFDQPLNIDTLIAATIIFNFLYVHSDHGSDDIKCAALHGFSNFVCTCIDHLECSQTIPQYPGGQFFIVRLQPLIQTDKKKMLTGICAELSELLLDAKSTMNDGDEPSLTTYVKSMTIASRSWMPKVKKPKVKPPTMKPKEKKPNLKLPEPFEVKPDDDVVIVEMPILQDFDEDVVVVEMPKPEHDGEIHGDVECFGSVGSNRASEYPHPRFCCTEFPFAIHGVGNINACALCYCYCCDIIASQCSTWSIHCNAQHDHAWTSIRHELKRKKTLHA